MASNPTTHLDVQAQLPTVQLSLSRVGVTGVEKVVLFRSNGSEQLFSARFECVVDLGPDQKGAHMSRFEEVINDAIGEVVLNETTFKVETLAEHIAGIVRSRQGARRAEVSVEARFPEHKPAPVSGIQTQELYTLHGAVVEKAHRRPRFVEDCVREMVRGVIEAFPGLADAAFVEASQVNLETIHQHNVVAERFGTLDEVRRELETGVPPATHTTRRAWLDAAGSAV